MAEVAAAYIGIMGVIGVVDVSIKAFTHVYSFLETSAELGEDVRRVLNLCEHVKLLAESNRDLQLPESIANNLQSALDLVSNIATKYENVTRLERVKQIPRAKRRLEKLSVVEHQMKTVLALITACISGATSTAVNGIAADMLKKSLALQQLSSDIDSVRVGVNDANDKLDFLVSAAASGAVPLPTNVPGEARDSRNGRNDEWKYSDATVPNARDFMLGVDDLSVVRDLKNMVLSREGGRVAAFGVQGSGGVGKTTACTIVARDPDVRALYNDAILWMQLGENASAATVVKQVARVVRATGGHWSSMEIETGGDKDLAEMQEKARGWFSGKSILLVVDNVSPTNSALVRGGNWMGILQEIPSANSCVLFSTRSHEIAKLSDETVRFAPLTSFEEQKKLFLRHLGLRSSTTRISDEEFLDLHNMCGGVPLALATVAYYLRSDHNDLRTAVDALQTSFLEEEQAMVLGGHPGLFSIFGAVLSRLDGDKEERFMRKHADSKLLASRLPCSWTALYTSLCVVDKSSPHAPVGILAGLWGIEADLAKLVCRCFASLGLGSMESADRGSSLGFRIHDLQHTYCLIRCRHSSTPYFSLSSWHARLLEGLVRKRRAATSAATTAETSPLNTSSHRAAQYVDAFCAIRGDSEEYWIEQYWLDQFVRHVCGTDDGVGAATDVVTDFRWVRRVSERRSPAEVARDIEQLLVADGADVERSHEVGSSSGVSRGLNAMNEQDLNELADIAHVFRWEIPPEAASHQRDLSKKSTSKECAVHPGQWSVGDPGLAHRIIGRLGFLRGGEGEVEAATAGSSEVGRIGVMDALVASVKKYARGPWLCPKHPCFFGLDRTGLERVIRRPRLSCCVPCSHKREDCVALGSRDGNVYLHRLDSGEEVGVLHADDEATPIWSMTVSSRGPSVSNGVDATWLVVGHKDGVVRIWDVEGARCIARLHASVGVGHLSGIRISRDRGRVVACDLDNHFLHVWDISPEGEQMRYERVEVPGDEWTRRRTLSEFAAAAALCGESRPLDECSSIVTRFERDGLEMWVSTANDFIRAKGRRVACARVQGCDSRALMAAVDECHGGVTVVDSLTGGQLSESPPFWQVDGGRSKWDGIWVSASQVDGRTLVATSHDDWMVRVRSADSGALIGQWLARSTVDGIFIDGGSRRVLAVGLDELIVWSFARGASGQQGEAAAQLTEMNNARPSPIALNLMKLVGFSPDGRTAVSWDWSVNDFIVWDAATGNAVRRVTVDWPCVYSALAVATSADWTLVAGNKGERTSAHFTLFDSSGEERSRGPFHCHVDGKGEWSAAFTPDGRGCTVAVEDSEKDTKEVHQWTISDAGEMTELGNGKAPIALPPSACLEANPAKQLQLLLKDGYCRHLAVRRSVRVEQARCTCPAVAYFDSFLLSSCSWSSVAIPGGSVEHNNSSTVAVGLGDGTVHFMEFLEE